MGARRTRQDEGSPRHRIGRDADFEPESLVDGLRRDHLRGPSPGEDPAGAHHHDAVRVSTGLVEIVQDGHNRGAQELIELPAQLETST